MTAPALVFVHSPLVGPLTWRAVADRFTDAGHSTAVPDLTRVMAGTGPYQPAITRAVGEVAHRLGEPVTLVGHSGAGPLLPGIAAAAGGGVRALVYVDAGLPHPGRSWFQTAPPDLVDRLLSMASGGSLPPWHEWFPPDALVRLLPDQRVRARFTAQLASLPLAYFEEPASPATWNGPSGYLLLSEVYREDAVRAAGAGGPVQELAGHHLAMITSPDEVVVALRHLVAGITPCTAS
jgi:pimeloyl-ACP methyl ester carboxylesterase